MTEKELLELAVRDFPGLTIGRYVDDALLDRQFGDHGDLLAAFIVSAVSASFDFEASDEEQLETVCRSLLLLGGYRVTQDYCYEGRRRFPGNPTFLLLHVENELSRGPGYFRGWELEDTLRRARELTEHLPPGPKREAKGSGGS